MSRSTLEPSTDRNSSRPKVSPQVLDTLAQENPIITPLRIFWVIVAIAILIYAGIVSGLSFGELIEGGSNMGEYISRYFPPDFNDSGIPHLRAFQPESADKGCPKTALAAFGPFFNRMVCVPVPGEGTYIIDIIETVGMGIWGTVLAAIVAAPLSIIAAENVAPFWLVFIVRRFLDAMRAINEIVFALIFIVAVGLGPFAGVLALFIHTAGTLGKLFSEAIEAIEPGPVEGIRATGASKIQEVIFGVIPQVIPLWTSFTLYRFEANVRSATVLGVVGAGGIGVTLVQGFRGFKYGKVAAMLIMLIIVVTIIDTVSAKIRQRLV